LESDLIILNLRIIRWHIYNFNNGQGSNTYVNYSYEEIPGVDQNNWKKYWNDEISLMTNSSTARFGYHNSTDSKQHYEYLLAIIDGAYYVGFDFYANGSNPNQQVERDYIYNDWIVKISPGDGIYPEDTPTFVTITEDKVETEEFFTDNVIEAGRVICEDLGSYIAVSVDGGEPQFDRRDLDFNDVVFNAAIIQRNYQKTTIVKRDGQTISTKTVPTKDSKFFAKVDLYAAGGTIPLTVFGKEVHEKFGVIHTKMVNTFNEVSEAQGAFGDYNTSILNAVQLENDSPSESLASYDKYLFDMTDDVEYNADGKTIKSLIKKIPIIVKYGEGQAVNELDPGDKGYADAPQKLLVPINTRWACERAPIGPGVEGLTADKENIGAYTQFTRYVGNAVTSDYCFSEDNAQGYYLYPSIKIIPLWTDENKNDIYAAQGINRTQTTSTGEQTEYVLFKNDSGQSIGSGIDIITNTSLSNGNIIRVYGTNLNADNVRISNDGSGLVNDSGILGNGYVEFELSSTNINSLKKEGKDYYIIVISGAGTVTKVALVR